MANQQTALRRAARVTFAIGLFFAASGALLLVAVSGGKVIGFGGMLWASAGTQSRKRLLHILPGLRRSHGSAPIKHCRSW